MSNGHHLELKVPPPILTILSGCLIWAVTSWFHAYVMPEYWHTGISLLLCLVAFAFILPALVTFLIKKTTISPLNPEATHTLVQTGFFELSRNPICLGLLSLLVALSWCFGLGAHWLALLVFVGWITYFQIKPEEKALSTRFGHVYLDYCHRTRRWQ